LKGLCQGGGRVARAAWTVARRKAAGWVFPVVFPGESRYLRRRKGVKIPMKKPLRTTLIVLGALVVLVVVIGGAFLIIERSSFPKTRGTLTAPGLQHPVEILRDTSGVPHIYAQSMHDMYFAEGFVHAQDRFWQMEFWRRIGSGRLSELFGKTTLGTDTFLRIAGFRRVAEKEYAQLDPEARSVLEAYAQGVNAYIVGKNPGKLSLEFTLLKLQGVPLQIEPWLPVNTLTWLKIMSLDLGGNMRKELYTLDLLQSVGVSLTRDFFGTYRTPDMPYIVSDSELPKALLGKGARAQALTSDRLSDLSGVPTRLAGGFDPGSLVAFGIGAGIGSNNWVISGSRTATGKPFLANDPHLGIQMPSIWYEVDLSCSEQGADIGKNAGGPYHVRGMSFAGAPGVIIGHNDRIAWGVTNVNPDVEDLYIERINPQNPNQYEVNGAWVDMTLHREEIRVHGQDEPTVIIARETRHGPLVTDEGAYPSYKGFAINPHGAFPSNIELKALSLRWTALQPNKTIHAVILLDKARNFTEFRDALRQWDIPSQNVVYADVDGNIGYQTPGLIPIRKNGDGSLPAPGWVNDFEWTGFIPFDQLPWSYNPAKGYIVTANNPVTSPSYRYFLGNDWDMGYRARRIVQMIEKAPSKIALKDVQAMQADTLNTSALEIMPFLKELSFTDPAAAKARDFLASWDGRMDRESSGAALYGYFWQALLEEIFKNRLPAPLWSTETALDSNSRLLNTVEELLGDPTNPWWDNPKTFNVKETRDLVLQSAFQKALAKGTKAQGKDVTRWSWGKAHTAVFRNQTFGKSGIGLIERLFNRGPVGVSGGFQQVSSTDWKADKPFDVNAVSSMRQIVDLASLAGSLAMHTTGQSGHAGNRHYDDMIEPWRKVLYHPTYWDRATLESSGVEKLVLQPK
jgi:penicillin G amidase